MARTHAVSAIALVVTLSAIVSAQKPVVKRGAMQKVTATIQQIDSTKRLITFRTPDGDEEIVTAGPEVKRFNELKVGDNVHLTYYESTIYQLRRPNDGQPADSVTKGVSPTAGKLPGGTIARQSRETVTVKSIDASVPSITVTTDDGRTVSRKIQKKAYLDGVKPGDKIDIIYTEALLTSVTRAK